MSPLFWLGGTEPDDMSRLHAVEANPLPEAMILLRWGELHGLLHLHHRSYLGATRQAHGALSRSRGSLALPLSTALPHLVVQSDGEANILLEGPSLSPDSKLVLQPVSPKAGRGAASYHQTSAASLRNSMA